MTNDFGHVLNTAISAGGTELIDDTATAGNTTIFAGGYQPIEQLGIASSTTISGGVQHLLGSSISATVEAGGTQIVENGGIASNTTISAGGVIERQRNDSGTLFASGAGSLVQIAGGAVVSGGIAEVGDGTVEIEGASAENVSFLSSGSGGLDLDDATAYTGKVSGFGGVGHSNTHQYIDLTSVTFSTGEMVSSFAGGVLTVTSSDGGDD